MESLKKCENSTENKDACLCIKVKGYKKFMKKIGSMKKELKQLNNLMREAIELNKRLF